MKRGITTFKCDFSFLNVFAFLSPGVKVHEFAFSWGLDLGWHNIVDKFEGLPESLLRDIHDLIEEMTIFLGLNCPFPPLSDALSVGEADHMRYRAPGQVERAIITVCSGSCA